MDKKKTRTDLLADGRKRLQQFRRMKDGKGSSSHGKSSKKSTKGEQQEADADAASNIANSEVCEGEKSSPRASDVGVSDASVSHSTENSVSTDVDIVAVDPPMKPETASADIANVDKQEVEVHDTAIDSSKLNKEISLDVFVAPVSADIKDDSVLTDEAESRNREAASFSLQEESPDVSLIYSRGDQVTDEADSSGLKHFAAHRDMELEGDGGIALLEYEHNFKTPALEQAGIEDTGSQLECNDKAGVGYSSASTTGMPDLLLDSASSPLEVVENVGVVHDAADGSAEVVNVSPANVEDSKTPSGTGHFGEEMEDNQSDRLLEAGNQQYKPEESFIFVDESYEDPILSKSPNSNVECNACSPGDAPLISFAQLVEVIKRLNEEEYKLLLMSSKPTGSSISLQYGSPVLMERLGEELFVSTCVKDILHLQLDEHSNLQTESDHELQRLGGEISLLQSSLNEACEKCKLLAADLAECKYELQATFSGREELQLQFHAAKTEAEEATARASELKNRLERSESELLSTSNELADSKGLVGTLHAENENLNQIIASLTEERKKLLDENNARPNENEKMLEELANYNTLVATLQVESSELRRNIASVTEKCRKVEEEEGRLATENEKLSKELSDYKELIEVLQVENVIVRVELSIAMEDRKKLAEEKEYSINEIKRCSSELVALHERLSKENEERMQLEIELKEAITRLEQLAEENIFLKSSLEIEKATKREFDDMQAKVISAKGEAPIKVGSFEEESRDCENASFDGRLQQKDGQREILSGVPPPESFEQDVYDDALGFVASKRRLEEAEKIMQQLEKTIERMHSHEGFLSGLGGKVVAPAVSKLIQAFESKSQHEEHEAGETATTGAQSLAADPFFSMKEQAGDLKAILQQLATDTVSAGLLFKAERDGRSIANGTIGDLKFKFEALEEYTDKLEASNIEFGVLYEAVKQHVSDVKERNEELEGFYETLKHQYSNLKAEKSQICENLSECDLRIKDLQIELDDLQLNSENIASALRAQVESLQKEAVNRASTAEEWNSTVAQIIDAVRRLDDSLGLPIETATHGFVEVSAHATSSVSAAINTIDDLKEKLEVARSDYEATCTLFIEVNEKCNGLLKKNESAYAILDRLYCELKRFVVDSGSSQGSAGIGAEDKDLPDCLEYDVFQILIEQLENVLAEKSQLQSVNSKLNMELLSMTKDVEELTRRCADSNSIEKLIESVEGVVKLEDGGLNINGLPISHLESLVSSLVRKCMEAEELASSSRKEFVSRADELTDLQENVYQLAGLKIQQETEILLLKEHVSYVEDAFFHLQTELQEKVSELEQSEQKVYSIREKLSIAVAKGKGLISQRDSLKKSLSETSSKLERCLQELQLKDASLQELESKLKTYSESGERVEALESELSYIRNSATALRESFLLKDSLLQRIEEILEDLDLPENFHSRDRIEKVDWLARSATGNALPPTEWDQKSSVGASYSDGGFVVMDAWKKDVQPNSNSGEELRRKYEDLQGKFYGLAEQNEMLEQSLMERNQLVQRWEELLNKIDIPVHLRSLEPEDRIEWLGNAVLEATNERSSLLQNIGELENHCESISVDLIESEKKVSSLSADLEESQKRISDLEMNIQSVMCERDNLSGKLEILNSDQKKTLEKAGQFALDNEKLQNEVVGLQEKLIQKLGIEEHAQRIDGEICRLQNLVCNALKDPVMKGLTSDRDSIEGFERLLVELIDRYETLYLEKHHSSETEANLNDCRSRDIIDVESDVSLQKRDVNHVMDNDESNVDIMKKKLDETLSELLCVKEERDGLMEKQQALVCKVEELDRKRVELEELLIQEEQKSMSLREKLNVAVKKGKSLVQLRDSLKKTTEELSTELEHLKSEIKHRDRALVEYELKMRDWTSSSETVESLESENLCMRNRLTENNSLLHEKEHALSLILKALENIDVGSENYHSDPMKKLEHIAKLCHDMHAAMASSEEESRKSRRAAELLLAELNEVQDRNDSLQEELAKITDELTQITKDRDVAEATKSEAISRLERLSMVFTEDKKKKDSELVLLKSTANELWKCFSDIADSLDGILSEDSDVLQNLESGMRSCLQGVENDLGVHVPQLSVSKDNAISQNKMKFTGIKFSSETGMLSHFDDDLIMEVCSSLQELVKKTASIKAILREHSATFLQQANNVSKLVGSIQRGITTHKESFEAIHKDFKLKESAQTEKDIENAALQKNVALLYEACSSSLLEIESRRAELVNAMTIGDQRMNWNSTTFDDAGLSISGMSNFSSEKHVRDMVEKLSSAVKSFASLKYEIIEGENKEMKITISSLQKELQEKDIQRERICKDLVSQIKQAEAAATSYSLDLKSTKSHLNDVERKVQILEEERDLLEQRVKELEDQQTTSTELQEKVKLLTDTLTAKDQEIEALMQALDEEEVQMDDLKKRVEEQEKIVQQKNLDIENLEASCGKVVKKLSVTVSKFNELHLFSESLLAEVEKLQSQLQGRDSEISFLRQEVTRCTNDALVASQMNYKTFSDETYELLTWIGEAIALDVDFHETSQVHECKEKIQKKITSILSELDDLRVAVQSSDALLRMERSRVEDLSRKEESLEKSLREKESQINMLAMTGEITQPTNSSSEIFEVEPVINKWTVPGASTTSQVRSLRKVNNDQVAIAIDMDPSDASRLEDEDDEKAHGFRSLTSSRLVPKFTRPVSDMVDGLWVSCDRALMRQPALRLGIMLYWAIMHALLAAFVV